MSIIIIFILFVIIILNLVAESAWRIWPQGSNGRIKEAESNCEESGEANLWSWKTGRHAGDADKWGGGQGWLTSSSISSSITQLLPLLATRTLTTTGGCTLNMDTSINFFSNSLHVSVYICLKFFWQHVWPFVMLR